jgi:hypothetical protein
MKLILDETEYREWLREGASPVDVYMRKITTAHNLASAHNTDVEIRRRSTMELLYTAYGPDPKPFQD